MKATKENVLNIIDEVMNNREIDSIRNAILAIRDKVKELDEVNDVADVSDDGTIIIKELGSIVKVPLRGGSELCEVSFDDPEEKPLYKYVCLDTCRKIDTGIYGAMWYE